MASLRTCSISSLRCALSAQLGPRTLCGGQTSASLSRRKSSLGLALSSDESGGPAFRQQSMFFRTGAFNSKQLIVGIGRRQGVVKQQRGSSTGGVRALFTGIVEEMGTVKEVKQVERDGFEMTIAGSVVLEDVKLGDSIAVNGTCLTVIRFDAESVSVGLAPETLRRTSLGEAEVGAFVNLERSLHPTSRMGGHFVQGHVDGTGTIQSFEPEGDSLWVTVATTPELMKYIVPKGYISVDGTSLTVVKVLDDESTFTFMLVAYTQQKIVVPLKKVGSKVNLEVDIVGKRPKGSNGKIKALSTNARDLRHIVKGDGSSRHMHSAGTTSEALAIVKNRLQRGIAVDSYMYVDVLRRCSEQKDLLAAKQVHDCIIQNGMEKNPFVATTLLNVYIRCGEFLDARGVFDELEKKSVITWTMMIVGYANSGYTESALEIFKLMRQEGVRPNEVTYLCVLKACANPLALKWGQEVHECIRHAGFESDVRVGTALLQMYAKCGCITEARRVFDKLSNRNLITWSVMIGAYAASGNVDDARRVFDRMKIRDLITWNIMIGAYAESGRGVEAYRLFLDMRREGFEPNSGTFMSILNASASAGALEWVKEVHGHARNAGLESDLLVGSALVHMYGKSGNIDDARLVFDRMEKRDVVIWNIMIGGLAQHGCWHEAYRLFLRMRLEGFEPDSGTFVSILNPSSSAGALEWVKEVHDHARIAGLESDLRVGSALVHMYAKSGSIDDARLVFDRMEKRDVVTWTAMIGGLAQHGCGHEALELFRKMDADRVKPDAASFVAVLSACCHGGLLDDGRRLFLVMTQDYGIEPDLVHYNCMVDLLGRAGHLEEAKRFISDMPIEPDVVTWSALLGACRNYGNVELGELAAKELLKLEPNQAFAYVLLSNIYAAAGNWEKVSSVRTMMQKRRVRKEPGRSWIEVDNKTHEFVVGDTSHPEAKAIYTELNKLTEKLKAEGYIPDTRLVLHEVNEEDKELALCSHSEKLAIAYGLLHIPRGEPIRVRKNLRVCPDCHTATKFISKVTGREIIARDGNRFHHFKDGICSCGDYW